jgi:ATP-dependent Clp protease ATP-binding subunit ClpC
MFELYTEKARRVIFFARYEASQYGSPYIETEYLLLGLLREDSSLVRRFLGAKQRRGKYSHRNREPHPTTRAHLYTCRSAADGRL